MTALIADRNTPHTDAEFIGVPVAANAVIYAGAIVVANAIGYAAPGSTALNLKYIGRSEEFVDNTGGANGSKTVNVRRNKAFKWGNLGADAITQADLMQTCYIADDQTLAKTDGGGTRSAAGKVIRLDADGVWIE